jgi:hypothetical protein
MERQGFTTIYEMNSLQAYLELFSFSLSNVINNVYASQMTSASSEYTILQLNDLYIDPLYRSGTSSKCNGFVCCHTNEQGEVHQHIAPEDVAGIFGHTNCDMPMYGVS